MSHPDPTLEPTASAPELAPESAPGPGSGPLPLIDQLLRTRRTVHDFTDGDVDEALLDRALESAHHAPNHKLTWPWRFTKVGRETRALLLPLAVALKAAERPEAPLPPAVVAAIGAHLLNPAWLVVVRQVRSHDPFRAREDYAAVACAVQNLQLSLHAAGVASKWSTGALTRDPAILENLGIDRHAEDIVGFVWVGQPTRVPTLNRPPLDDTFVRRLP